MTLELKQYKHELFNNKPKDRALYGWEANPYVWKIEFDWISKEDV